LDKQTPPDAAAAWRTLRSVYKTVVYRKETWLTSVIAILSVIVEALLQDLGFATTLYHDVPALQHSQVGDVEWSVALCPFEASLLHRDLVMQLKGGPPTLVPGCSIELKTTSVLLHIQGKFEEPYILFADSPPYADEKGVLFKVGS
jgi:hypothetical protein